MKTLLITITALLLFNCSNPTQPEQDGPKWEYYESSHCSIQDNNYLWCPDVGVYVDTTDYSVHSTTGTILGEGNLLDGEFIPVEWTDVEFKDIKGEIHLDSNGDIYFNYFQLIP
jgi:hypothetical protein